MLFPTESEDRLKMVLESVNYDMDKAIDSLMGQNTLANSSFLSSADALSEEMDQEVQGPEMPGT